MLNALVPCLVLAMLSSPAPTADEKVGFEQLRTLLEVGYTEDEILAYLKRDGIRIEISAEDLTRLEKLKAPAGVLAFLKPHVRTAKDDVTLDDLISVWKTVKDPAAVRAAARRSPRAFPVGISDALRLRRAGFPQELIRFLRDFKPAPAPGSTARSLSTEDIVRRTALGAAPAELIAEIRSTDSSFSLTTDDLVRLHRDGVAREVLREIYQRNRPQETADAAPAVTPVRTPIARDEGLEPVKLVPLADRGRGFQLLVPEGFVSTREYRGKKALMQLIEPSRGGASTLPDLELSVLTVNVGREQPAPITAERLIAVADRFVSDLRKRFEADGISLHAEKPERTWVSGQRAVRVETKTTSPDGSGYVGANYIVFSDGKVFVVSHNARVERSAAWRDTLEDCARSLELLEQTPAPLPEATGDDRAELTALFDRWRKAVRRFDLTGWAGLHAVPKAARKDARSFISDARTLAREGQRIEMSSIDVKTGRVIYKRFGLDGRTEHMLSATKTVEGWRLSLPE